MTTFFHLPREDVVFPLILLRLDTVATWKLRRVCRGLWKLCEDYFETFCPCILYTEHDSRDSDLFFQHRMCVSRALRTCKKLKYVYLHLLPPCDCARASRSTHRKACRSLLASVWHIHKNCQLVSLKLVNMDCSGCEELHSGWEKLSERCLMLKELHVEAISQFDDICLEKLTKDCTLLVQLTLKALPEIQGLHLPRLTDACPQLEMLNLSGCYNIGAGQLERAVRVCYHLKRLNLSSLFAAVTDTTMLSVKEFCAELQWLNIAQCSRVTGRYLLPLEERGVQVHGKSEHLDHSFHKVWGQI